MESQDTQCVSVAVRVHVRELLNSLSKETSGSQKTSVLKEVSLLLPGPTTTTTKVPRYPTITQITTAKQIFAKEHYANFAKHLIDLATLDWISALSKSELLLFDNFFLNGAHDQAFNVLCSSVYTKGPCYTVNKCVSLLEAFIRRDLLAEVMWDQCLVTFMQTWQHADQICWREDLVRTIASLPDKMANALKGENSDLFLPVNYVSRIAKYLVSTLRKCHDRLSSEGDCSLEFSSQLLGKLCITGYAELLWQHLLPSLLVGVKRDYIWCRLCERLVTGVPDRCMEAALVPLLQRIPWYGNVERFLGDCVIQNIKVQFLLCTKLLLMRFFEDTRLVQNVLGYLSSSPARRPLFKKCLKSLLDVWVDGSAIKHTCYEQHFYLSRALMISLGFLRQADKEEYKHDFLSKLSPGMQHHLGCPDIKMRTLGMVVAENITKTLDPNGPKLEFQHESSWETDLLKSLLTPPEDPSVDQINSEVSNLKVKEDSREGEVAEKRGPASEAKEEEAELDSDDDLPVYDMSHDTQTAKVKAPYYIRDCMEGLICSENPDRLEACLTVAETLIRAEPDGLKEIAAEFTKILLHLSNLEVIPAFGTFRFGAMLALTVHSPTQVVPYLTTEFYKTNYNLKQRMDMLQVLSAAAQELSSPSPGKKSGDPASANQKIEMLNPGDEEPKSWREIVERRIEKKTRRFAKGRQHPEPEPTKNAFTPVAGLFFFPLLKNYDRKENTFDLLGEDTVVLTRFLYTLGLIIHSAINLPIARQMGTSMMEFIWVLRYHNEASVRRGLLFSLAMVFLSVPAYFLMTDLHMEVTEAKDWLQYVVENDVDTESRKLAVQVLVLLENLIKQEFQTGAVS